MTSFNVAPFHLYDEEHSGTVQRHNSNIWVGIFFSCIWLIIPSKMNEFCCHGALFLWQLHHFFNMGCLSNMVAIATYMKCLLKITANLIVNICYYALRMNEPSLNDSKKMWFLTLFKCVLVNLLQNVIRSLLSARGPYVILIQLRY